MHHSQSTLAYIRIPVPVLWSSVAWPSCFSLARGHEPHDRDMSYQIEHFLAVNGIRSCVYACSEPLDLSVEGRGPCSSP